MIVETKVHTCCQVYSKEIVKNNTNGYCNPLVLTAYLRPESDIRKEK